MKKLIITGGLGFAGKHFYNYIKNKWDKIIIIDKKTYAADLEFFLKFKRKQDKLIIGDICNKKFLEKNIPNSSTIIHFAAESHVDNSFTSSILFTKNNTFGTHNILEVCRMKSIEKIVYISTDEIYGESKKIKKENSLLRPTNPYSASKAGADLIVQSYILAYKLPINIIRPNNLYGYRQHAEKIIPAIVRAANGGAKLKIHGKGQTQRNFLNVNDFSEAVELIINKAPNYEIYNVKGEKKYKILDLIKLAGKIKNLKLDEFAIFVNDRPFNDKIYTIDGKKIKNLGWSEKSNFDKCFYDILINNSYIE